VLCAGEKGLTSLEGKGNVRWACASVEKELEGGSTSPGAEERGTKAVAKLLVREMD